MVIVDASVAYKWYSPKEIFSNEALKLLEDHLSKIEVLCSPNLLLYELANAWATKTKLSRKQQQKNLNSLETAHLILEELGFELISRAVELSNKYGVTVYDASYAILAEYKGCIFVTADSRLAEKLKLPFVRHLGEYFSNIN